MISWIIITLGVLLSSFFVMVLFHELTHLALSTEPTGLCIGFCESSTSRFAGGAAWAEHNPTSMREDIPNAIGFGVVLVWVIVSFKAIVTLIGGKE